MILFFDTETNGLPKNYKAAANDLENWPRVIQLAWACFSFQGELLEKHCYLIKPEGWTIPNEPFWTEKNYTTERSLAEGHQMEKVLASFVMDVNVAGWLVAHNMAFDAPVITSEMIRLGVSVKNKPQRFCTMVSSTNIVCIPSMRGYKWPKLEELHRFLFGVDFEGAHDALNDVLATAKCYFELRKRGFINPEGRIPEKPSTPMLDVNTGDL